MSGASPSRSRRSLAVASLDIARVLADRDGTTFRVQGACMYPTIRAGDVLRIRSCVAADLCVGDIAVCRTPEYLFGHRVIAVGERDGRAYVVTRPDRSCAGGDAPTFDDDLLGVVVRAERDGVAVPLQPTEHAWVARRYLDARLAWAEAATRARRWSGEALVGAQGRESYVRLAPRCFARMRPRLSFMVRVPLNATLGDALCRRLAPSEFDPGESWRGRPVDRWTLTLHVNGVHEPAAWASFARSGADAWRADESSVRVRYRGLGLEALLLRRAEAIVARGGGRIVSRGI